MTDMKSTLKIPLLIAALLVVGRVVLERLGAPDTVNQLFGVAWLYFLVPFYFASRIAKANEPRPFVSLLKTLAVYALITRIMIAPTYWAAYAFSWPEARFSIDQGGVVGGGMSF